MVKFWKKDYDELSSTPQETLGFSKDKKYHDRTFMQNFLIKMYDLKSIEQTDEIKKQLLDKKILIINAKDLLKERKISILDLKKSMDEIKAFLKEFGGTIGRIGDQFLVITPNAHIRISF